MSRAEQGLSGTDVDPRRMAREKKSKAKLVSPDVLLVLRDGVELCTTEVGTGFSSSFIPTSSSLHYSFNTGEEEKQREGGD